MERVLILIRPYAFERTLDLQCREGFSVIELDHWWLEIGQDYGLTLTAENDNRMAA